mmetsp:Transcript_32012/g.95227  ORF Transcript_32012/g.95227 Transcript_32012/m.95227 type:complete len:326 (-) Transcript_32012:714-1691(-)
MATLGVRRRLKRRKRGVGEDSRATRGGHAQCSLAPLTPRTALHHALLLRVAESMLPPLEELLVLGAGLRGRRRVLAALAGALESQALVLVGPAARALDQDRRPLLAGGRRLRPRLGLAAGDEALQGPVLADGPIERGGPLVQGGARPREALALRGARGAPGPAEPVRLAAPLAAVLLQLGVLGPELAPPGAQRLGHLPERAAAQGRGAQRLLAALPQRRLPVLGGVAGAVPGLPQRHRGGPGARRARVAALQLRRGPAPDQGERVRAGRPRPGDAAPGVREGDVHLPASPLLDAEGSAALRGGHQRHRPPRAGEGHLLECSAQAP